MTNTGDLSSEYEKLSNEDLGKIMNANVAADRREKRFLIIGSTSMFGVPLISLVASHVASAFGYDGLAETLSWKNGGWIFPYELLAVGLNVAHNLYDLTGKRGEENNRYSISRSELLTRADFGDCKGNPLVERLIP